MRNKWLKRFFPKTLPVLLASFIFTIVSIFIGNGATISQAAPEPQTTLNTNTSFTEGFQPAVQTRLVETRTVEYVDRPVTVVEYVERVKRIPVELRNYSDLEELEKWLGNVDRNTTTIYFEQPDAPVDCDDYALWLQQKALADGYILSFQIIEPDNYNRLFQNHQLPANALHAINLAIIGNNAYYIEPQTDEVVLAAQLD